VIETVGTISTILAVIGVIANNRRLRVCFLLWMVSNVLTAGIHAQAAIWSLLVRDAIFFVLAIEGWYKWGRESHSHSGTLDQQEIRYGRTDRADI